MASTRIVLGIGMATATLALVVACSGSSTGNGTSGGTSGTSGTSGSSSSIKNCSTGNTGTSKCTAEELQPYGECVQDKCAPAYTECYGPDYKSGVFAGPCGTYISCTNACECADTACRQKCTVDATCTTCITGKLGSCSAGCTIPACATGGTSGSSGTSGASGTSGTSGATGKTCADLAACCAAITDTSIKSACDQAKMAAGTMDTTCNAYYNSFMSYCSGG